MAQAVILPKLGQTMEEGAIVKWHKKVGDPVKKGDILFEIETDKAALEVESFFEGILLKVLIAESITVPVNTVVGYVGEKGEKVPDAPPPPPAPVASAPAPQAQAGTPAVSPAPLVSAQSAAPKATARPAAPAAPAAPRRLMISPRAKALASASVIDAARIRGTGPGGRIVEKDVQNYLDASGYANLRISPAAKSLAAKEKIDILSVRGTGEKGQIRVEDVNTALAERPKPMSKMRQVIARRLTESFTSTPHFYVTVAVDMTDLMKFRQELKARGIAYTVTDFILEAVIMSLKEFPGLNSSTDGTTTTWHSKVNLGLAVSIPEGLVVPPIRNAEDLTLAELHDANQTLAGKARDGKLLPDEMTGSTFTVSNMGMLNVENFCAIINPGESAILAISTTRDTPAVRDGKILIRSIMKMTLSTDHRIVDGAMGSAFANAVKTKLEDIELWKRLTSS